MKKVAPLVENIKSTDSKGRNAVWWAAKNDNLEALKYAVESGVDYKLADKSGKTPEEIAEESYSFSSEGYFQKLNGEF